MAFLINAYYAFAIQLILTRYPKLACSRQAKIEFTEYDWRFNDVERDVKRATSP